jgi:hypothetical protein
MRQYLLPQDGCFYKANLHCHTTHSDGAMTPEEIKRSYLAEGYSIVAYTDHNIMLSHADLRDASFLPLTGFEADFIEGRDTTDPNLGVVRTCHLCMIAPTEQYDFERDAPGTSRAYTPENINAYIARFANAGFFITYNHPTWSLECYREFSQYRGFDAMEICNFGCFTAGFDEENSRYYDDMLHLGMRIGCVATDDNHNHHPRDHAKWDSFGAYTYIKATALTYDDIFAALKAGNYYASRGPKIEELYIEDGKVHLRCSPASRIMLVLGTRRGDFRQNADGSLITEAVFDLSPGDVFFRLAIWDEHMRPAHTRAYFMDEVSM